MKYSLVKTEFEVSGSKNFKPADYINKLDKMIPPLLQDTEYNGSIGVLRDLRSGMRLRRLMEFNLFPPEKILIDDYNSERTALCGKCRPNAGICNANEFTPKSGSITTAFSKKYNPDYCNKRVKITEDLSLCPDSALNVGWDYFFTIASIFSVAYAKEMPVIEKVGTAIRDDIIKTYNISPMHPQ